jgi:Tfp pilus assembly protein PilZ
MSDEIVKTSITGNLSEEGMFIKSKRKIHVGSAVYIKLESPNFQELQIMGEVVRIFLYYQVVLGSQKAVSGFT